MDGHVSSRSERRCQDIFACSHVRAHLDLRMEAKVCYIGTGIGARLVINSHRGTEQNVLVPRPSRNSMEEMV